MNTAPDTQGKILFLPDASLSRERAHMVMRTVNSFRRFAQVEILRAHTTEFELINRLRETDCALVLLPWKQYTEWKKLEAHFGMHRSGGPTSAGYFGEALSPESIKVPSEFLRTILFDFSGLKPMETFAQVRALVNEQTRSGILPLIHTISPVYWEPWTAASGFGSRVETLMSLPEFQRVEWIKRHPSLRILLWSLWSFVYEEGPGKSDLLQGTATGQHRAQLMACADEFIVALRLITRRPGYGPRDALQEFYPKENDIGRAAQLILKHSDFVRVHSYPESHDVEIVCGFYSSQPSEEDPKRMRTLWIEPLPEPPKSGEPLWIQTPSQAKAYTPLPASPVAAPRSNLLEQQLKLKERVIRELQHRLQELQIENVRRDDLILELRRGGVSPQTPAPQPTREVNFDELVRALETELALEATKETRGRVHGRTSNGSRRRRTPLNSKERDWLERFKKLLDQHQGRLLKASSSD